MFSCIWKIRCVGQGMQEYRASHNEAMTWSTLPCSHSHLEHRFQVHKTTALTVCLSLANVLILFFTILMLSVTRVCVIYQTGTAAAWHHILSAICGALCVSTKKTASLLRIMWRMIMFSLYDNENILHGKFYVFEKHIKVQMY